MQESEIKKYLVYQKKENKFYDLLMKFDKRIEDKTCYECLKELTTKVEFAASQFHNLSVPLKNKLENDFITLKDLDLELKTNVYPFFDNRALTIFSTLKEEEMASIYNEIEKNNSVFDSKKLLVFVNQMFCMLKESFPSFQETIQNILTHPFTMIKIEEYIVIIKKMVANAQDEKINLFYYKLMAYYFGCMYHGE